MKLLLFCLFTKSSYSQKTTNDLAKYVDPYIGTGFHGHVFLGANVPFGAVQLGPVNISQGWDWCSGYHYSDSTIIGFSHTHLSGTGIGDLGDILLMPATGDIKPFKGRITDPESGYYSLFSHKEEKAEPGYYSVRLKRYDILAELTTSTRVGFHQYTFPQSDKAQLIIDLQEGIGWDRPVTTFIQKLTDTSIVGYRLSRGWANDQRIYFAIIFSKPLKEWAVYDSTAFKNDSGLTARKVKGIACFDTKKNEKIRVKVGISPVSTGNAMLNIRSEIPGWDFRKTAINARNAWNKELAKVKIKAKDKRTLRNFYTALYHTMIAPSVFNDHNNDYLGTDKKVYKNASFTNLTVFSLWDTYRAAHPLFTIMQPEKVDDMISSMLAIYQQQGKLPVWHLAGNETNTMPGNSGTQVVADAYLKGFRGFDTTLAWEAVKTTAMQDARGMAFVKANEFIPADSMVESVAMGLEYAIADGAIAQMAKRMNKTADYDLFSKRAKYYKNYFDPAAGFVRGRVSATQWREPFSPFVARHMKDDFSEGNAWQYTWLVPHDVKGLINLLGGEQAFNDKLDSLFVVSGDMGKEASADITGLIGQYAHGNEPSHHITYLYAFTGQPWKTADKVRFILDSFYTDKPAGLIGNEDVGQLSAWYVFSALGFYPVNPFNGVYIFGSPVLDQADLSVGNNKTFRIRVQNNSAKNKYIQKIFLNEKPYTKSYIRHEDIIKGGDLRIVMGPKPSLWGTDPGDRPSDE